MHPSNAGEWGPWGRSLASSSPQSYINAYTVLPTTFSIFLIACVYCLFFYKRELHSSDFAIPLNATKFISDCFDSLLDLLLERGALHRARCFCSSHCYQNLRDAPIKSFKPVRDGTSSYLFQTPPGLVPLCVSVTTTTSLLSCASQCDRLLESKTRLPSPPHGAHPPQ